MKASRTEWLLRIGLPVSVCIWALMCRQNIVWAVAGIIAPAGVTVALSLLDSARTGIPLVTVACASRAEEVLRSPDNMLFLPLSILAIVVLTALPSLWP